MKLRHVVPIAALVGLYLMPTPEVGKLGLFIIGLGLLIVFLGWLWRFGAAAIDAHFDRRRDSATIARWVGEHAFPGDTVADLLERVGEVTLEQVHSEQSWWRSGYEHACREATARRSAAARRGRRFSG